MNESDLHTALQAVTQAAAADAVRVDRDAAFPDATLTAARQHGLLGLVSHPSVGGAGLGLAEASRVIEALAGACGSSAMVLTMHYAAVAVLEATGNEALRRSIAAVEHLSTLAFSERGSRSHFWAPLGKPAVQGSTATLSSSKSFVTSARHASSYVWSSLPLGESGLSSLWLVPRNLPGVSVGPAFDGLGLRGNDSSVVEMTGATLARSSLLGADGKGFDLMMGSVLPWFSVLSASCSLGLAAAAYAATTAHVSATRLEHVQSSLAELPTIRAQVARMNLTLTQARLLVADAITAIMTKRADALLRILQTKAAAAECALSVTDAAMRACGGAAFRRDFGLERAFRDARAASVMGPTTDVLYDFIGKHQCGLDLFGGAS